MHETRSRRSREALGPGAEFLPLAPTRIRLWPSRPRVHMPFKLFPSQPRIQSTPIAAVLIRAEKLALIKNYVVAIAM
jgi:hypothetical protein